MRWIGRTAVAFDFVEAVETPAAMLYRLRTLSRACSNTCKLAEMKSAVLEWRPTKGREALMISADRPWKERLESGSRNGDGCHARSPNVEMRAPYQLSLNTSPSEIIRLRAGTVSDFRVRMVNKDTITLVSCADHDSHQMLCDLGASGVLTQILYAILRAVLRLPCFRLCFSEQFSSLKHSAVLGNSSF